MHTTESCRIKERQLMKVSSLPNVSPKKQESQKIRFIETYLSLLELKRRSLMLVKLNFR